MAGTILYKLSLDATKFETGLKKAERSLQRTAKKMERLGSSLSRYVTAPIAGLAVVAVRSFDKQAKAVAQVEQGLKSTGNAAGFTKDQLLKMASDLQKTTLFGDEEILQGATAQLLTFTNIAGEQFARTQKIAMDLATRLDTDLKSATIMVAKAMNDPIANLSAMSRAGIQFSESQKVMIKEMAKTGRMAEAQNIILGELERQYGGSAEAAVTGAGKLKQLQNAVGDLAEQFGSIVLEFIDPLIKKIQALTERLSNMSEDTKKNIVKWAAFAMALGPVIFAIGKVVGLIGMITKAIRLLTVALETNPIILIITAIVAAIAGLIFVIESVRDSAYAFAGYFIATWERIQIAFLRGENFVKRLMANIVNAILKPINNLRHKLGMDDIFSEIDVSDTIDKNNAKIDELQAKIDANPFSSLSSVWDEFSAAAGANMDKVKSIFSFALGSINDMAKETGAILGSTLGGGGGKSSRGGKALPKMTGKSAGTVSGGLSSVDMNIETDKLLAFGNEQIMKANSFGKAIIDVGSALSEVTFAAFSGITDAIETAFSGGSLSDTFKSFLKPLANVAIRIGKIVVGIGMAVEATKKSLISLHPILAIVAGTALIALGSFAKKAISGVGAKMANGGIVPGGYDNDTYPALLSSGEMVIPKPIALSGVNNSIFAGGNGMS